ncbi:DMT family transporter [Pseudolabrys sp. FHR47]|uniref:DMT family transporter n=1 Tax=Pseudolabrys sp. FHR47 TaxID=2562284 RepID=UPI0010BF12AE|nr:DMT family transporter [Pseudolabrys sp. FHR47]
MIDSLTIALMLSAALLHASWHALIKSAANGIAAIAGMGLVATAVAAAVMPFVPFPPAAVWPVIAGSVCLHCGYKLALARSYSLGDLGQAFPLARGFVPLFAAGLAFLVMGELPKSGQVLGIAVVSGGLIWLSADSVRGGVDGRLFLAALVAGMTVAGYAVVDAYGTRLAGDWLSFTVWLVIVDSGSFFLLILAVQGRQLLDRLWIDRTRTLASGLLGIGSFGVFLWALSRSPVGPVAALRESSVLFAAIIGMVWYGEARSPHRLGAAAVIFAGLMIIAVLR